MNKNEVRKLIKGKFNSMTEDFESKNHELAKNLLDLISQLNFPNDGTKHLGVYSPLKDEPTWWRGIEQDLPPLVGLVHMHDDLQLSYYEVELKSLTDMKYSLKVNTGHLREVDPDVLLIPGVAFTRNCERLGRGKGYFDSYLSKFKGVKIGVFYAFQEVEKLPMEAHDELLDFIVTDKEIIVRG